MRKFVIIVGICLIVFSLCSFTSAEDYDEGGMYIDTAHLSEGQMNLAKAMGADNLPLIFYFQADNHLTSVDINTYSCIDGVWENMAGKFACSYDLAHFKGKIDISYSNICDGRTVSLKCKNCSDTYEYNPEKKISDRYKDLKSGKTMLSHRMPLVYGEEIPIAIQIFTGKDEATMILGESMEEIMSYYKDVETGNKAIYVITVKFNGIGVM